LCKEGRSGSECRQCKPGFYQFPDCVPCNCNEYGSNGLSCNSDTGKCNCKPQFIGDKCNECAPNLYNFPSCEECTCNPDGVTENFQGCSTNNSILNCPCKLHVTGRQCDRCKPRYYGLGSNYENGCSSCECSPIGTLNQLDVCDTTSGQCLCKDFAISKSCNQCKPGTYNLNKDNIFGCDLCYCNLGASIDNTCDSQTGQCKCRPNIIGRTCNSALNGYFIPSLHDLKFELEDGLTSNGKQVRYDFNETHFANYSGKGYVGFTKIQNEIHYEIQVENRGSFQVIFRYVCKSSNICEFIFQMDELSENIVSFKGFLIVFL
jgi:laminin, alpha 3/5